MNLEIYNLYADNKKLPKGTRIRTTSGGVYTGEDHELSDALLESANKIPNTLSEYAPFWILGWRDLHDDLFIPDHIADAGKMICTCKKCGYTWYPRKANPKCCPECKSRRWND